MPLWAINITINYVACTYYSTITWCHYIFITYHTFHVAPIAGGKSDIDIAAHCLELPGNVLNLSTLLDKKKFRMYGSKVGAIKGFKFLEGDGLGTLEVCGGRGINKVGTWICIWSHCKFIMHYLYTVVSLQEKTLASR